MNSKIKGVLTLGLIFGCGVALAKDEPRVIALQETFRKVPAAEVPAKAADIVSQTDASSRNAVAADVVKAALKKRSTIAPSLVGAICRKAPETAPTVAATAAELQPKQAKVIAQAAAAAAPAQAGEIVKAVCKVAPRQYREVALAVSKVAPNSAREILAGLSEALPTLRPRIDQAIASSKGQPLVVASVLDRVAPADASLAVASGVTAPPPVRGPTIAGPYIPLSTTPTNLPPTGGDMPAGSRDYSPP